MSHLHRTLESYSASNQRTVVYEDLNESVLLVESNRDLRETLAEALRSEGFYVIEAATGEAALEVLRSIKETVEWLVTNVHPTGLSGLHVAFEYRFRFPARPIVFIEHGRSPLEPVLLTCSRWLPQPYSSGELLLLMKELRADKHGQRTAGC